MSYGTHDTDWAASAKGNMWRRQDGKVLVVGERKNGGGYWAMCDGEFVRGTFATRSTAMLHAEAAALKDEDRLVDLDDDWWDV